LRVCIEEVSQTVQTLLHFAFSDIAGTLERERMPGG